MPAATAPRPTRKKSPATPAGAKKTSGTAGAAKTTGGNDQQNNNGQQPPGQQTLIDAPKTIKLRSKAYGLAQTLANNGADKTVIEIKPEQKGEDMISELARKKVVERYDDANGEKPYSSRGPNAVPGYAKLIVPISSLVVDDTPPVPRKGGGGKKGAQAATPVVVNRTSIDVLKNLVSALEVEIKERRKTIGKDADARLRQAADAMGKIDIADVNALNNAMVELTAARKAREELDATVMLEAIAIVRARENFVPTAFVLDALAYEVREAQARREEEAAK